MCVVPRPPSGLPIDYRTVAKWLRETRVDPHRHGVPELKRDLLRRSMQKLRGCRGARKGVPS